MSPYLSVAAVAALLATGAVPALAQARPMSAEAAMPARARGAAPEVTRESVINWFGELQRIGAHLQWVHDRALQDPELRAAREALMSAVKDAMDAEDPELAGLALRAAEIPAEHEAAVRRGDAAAAAALHRELARIQARFLNVEAHVLRLPAIARQARAYEELLRRRLVGIEPDTEALLERSTQLQRLLNGALNPRD